MNLQDERNRTDHAADKRSGETYPESSWRHHLEKLWRNRRRESEPRSVAGHAPSGFDFMISYDDMTLFAKLFYYIGWALAAVGGAGLYFHFEIFPHLTSELMFVLGIGLILLMHFSVTIVILLQVYVIYWLYQQLSAQEELLWNWASIVILFKALLMMGGLWVFKKVFSWKKG